ncbi:MAG TPA: hypothetical protein PK878_05820 [bacterium]|jgi:hypothetical protein|nr:hypothetical protein [Candidatus Omnitrophota bacterium]HOJ59783.1 hypothetical protein [bacterium]HOL93902.1 hypothetical protein [bacterium]HPP00342.1 hypothetical protein [bacterium]HXK93510.1 hypothetical protein [bacterium]
MGRQFLRGKVVSILDDQRLIVNLGMEHGVSMGDRFVVYEEGGEITDPSTQQSLGKLELIKAQVEAVHVQEKMSLLMPILKQTTTQSTVLSATLAQTYSTTSSDIYRDRLPVKKDQISGLSLLNSLIMIGDLVRSVKPVDA